MLRLSPTSLFDGKFIAYGTDGRRIDPMSLSARPFCHGERGAVG
jgi:hypothetical protein